MRIRMQMRFALILSALFMGSAQAVVVDTIGGFGDSGDVYAVDATVNNIQVTSAIGVTTTATEYNPPGGFYLADTQLGGAGGSSFEQDYEFIDVSSGLFALSILDGNEENNGFTDLFIAVYDQLNDALGAVDTINLVSGGVVLQNTASLSLGLTGVTDFMIRVGGVLNGTGTPGYELLVVSAVPVPAAGLLFGSALLGLVGLRRRKDKALAA